MEISIKKLKEFIGVNGKYVKNHYNLNYLDRNNPEEDYVCINQHYILVLDKNAIQYDSKIKEINVMNRLEKEADMAKDIEYLGLRYLDEKQKKAVCRFGIKGCEESEEVWINKTFFTEFINKAFSPTKGFADGITFTGSDSKHTIFMWNEDEELVGAFLPIRH